MGLAWFDERSMLPFLEHLIPCKGLLRLGADYAEVPTSVTWSPCENPMFIG